MNIQKTLEDFFASYGCSFTIGEDPGIFRGVFSSASAEVPKAEAAPLGLGITGSRRLLTKVGVAGLVKGASLKAGGECYFVEAAADYTLGDAPIYRYAVLRKLRERTVEHDGIPT